MLDDDDDSRKASNRDNSFGVKSESKSVAARTCQAVCVREGGKDSNFVGVLMGATSRHSYNFITCVL